MLPLAGVLSVKAPHAVTTSGSLSPQYVASWCQETNPGLRAFFVKKDGKLGGIVRAFGQLDGTSYDTTVINYGQDGYVSTQEMIFLFEQLQNGERPRPGDIL